MHRSEQTRRSAAAPGFRRGGPVLCTRCEGVHGEEGCPPQCLLKVICTENPDCSSLTDRRVRTPRSEVDGIAKNGSRAAWGERSPKGQRAARLQTGKVRRVRKPR